MRQRIKFGGQSEIRKELCDVAGFCGERLGPVEFGFLGQKQAPVFLERRAATRRIRDDRVEILQPEGG